MDGDRAVPSPVPSPALSAARAVETELALLAQHLTEPGARECLRCYLLRMITEFGCDGTHRWTIRWRDLRAPRARGLVGRLQQRGGICCDCEVVLNVFSGYPRPRRGRPCAGVLRSGSALPCSGQGEQDRGGRGGRSGAGLNRSA